MTHVGATLASATTTRVISVAAVVPPQRIHAKPSRAIPVTPSFVTSICRVDPKDPEFADKHMVTFTGSGRELEQLVLNQSATVPDSLRRRIHPKVRRFLRKLDRLPDAEATDAVAFLFGLSDRQLQQMGEYWIQAEEKTKADGKFHSVSGLPTPGGGGFTIICGRGTRDEFERLQFLVLLNKYKHRAPIWLGIGALPDGEEDPFAVTLDSRPWKPDPELDRLFPVWPLPGSTTERH